MDNKNKPTPGEWKREGPNSPKIESSVITGASGMVAYVHGRCYSEAEANAALIVAAVNACCAVNPENPLAVAESLPELVKACQSMTLHHNQGQLHAIDIQRVKAALAKLGAK